MYRMKVIEAENAVDIEDEVNNFIESITGYGYELTQIENNVLPDVNTKVRYVTTIHYYQNFKEDPWKELNDRLTTV